MKTNKTLKRQFSNSDDAWHTLDGRKVSKPTRGIYIKGGRKVVIK